MIVYLECPHGPQSAYLERALDMNSAFLLSTDKLCICSKDHSCGEVMLPGRPLGDVCRDQGLHVGSSGPLLPTASSPAKTLMNLTTSIDTLAFSPDTQVCLVVSFLISPSGIGKTFLIYLVWRLWYIHSCVCNLSLQGEVCTQLLPHVQGTPHAWHFLCRFWQWRAG